MPMPQPDDNHAGFQRLAGAWVGTEKMHPSQWMPEARTATAKLVNTLGAGGFVLHQDYEQRLDGAVTFSGHGVFWFDQESGEHRLHWWDAMGMSPNLFRGRWEGDKVVLESESPMGKTRGTWVLKGDGYEHVMEMSQDGESWKVLMEGSYQRA